MRSLVLILGLIAATASVGESRGVSRRTVATRRVLRQVIGALAGRGVRAVDAPRAENAGPAPRIALGLSFQPPPRAGVSLSFFAARTRAVPWEQWAAAGIVRGRVPRNFSTHYFRKALDATVAMDGHIVFDLTGVDLDRALSATAPPHHGGYTSWELRAILANPAWLARTTFFLDDRPIGASVRAALGLGRDYKAAARRRAALR